MKPLLSRLIDQSANCGQSVIGQAPYDLTRLRNGTFFAVGCFKGKREFYGTIITDYAA
jgi:hypothetical protein